MQRCRELLAKLLQVEEQAEETLGAVERALEMAKKYQEEDLAEILGRFESDMERLYLHLKEMSGCLTQVIPEGELGDQAF